MVVSVCLAELTGNSCLTIYHHGMDKKCNGINVEIMNISIVFKARDKEFITIKLCFHLDSLTGTDLGDRNPAN